MLATLSWPLFSSTFALIFLAELPDKTIFAVLLLAVSHRPWPVFVGASLAFLIQTLVALLGGSLLTIIPAEIIRYGSAALFFFFAVQMWRKSREPEEEAAPAGAVDPSQSFGRCLWLSFITIFAAEWGDLSQLATATLVAKYQNPLTIGAAATLALWSATGLGAVLGHAAKGVMRPHILHRIGAVAMAGAGAYLLIKGG